MAIVLLVGKEMTCGIFLVHVRSVRSVQNVWCQFSLALFITSGLGVCCYWKRDGSCCSWQGTRSSKCKWSIGKEKSVISGNQWDGNREWCQNIVKWNFEVHPKKFHMHCDMLLYFENKYVRAEVCRPAKIIKRQTDLSQNMFGVSKTCPLPIGEWGAMRSKCLLIEKASISDHGNWRNEMKIHSKSHHYQSQQGVVAEVRWH